MCTDSWECYFVSPGDKGVLSGSFRQPFTVIRTCHDNSVRTINIYETIEGEMHKCILPNVLHPALVFFRLDRYNANITSLDQKNRLQYKMNLQNIAIISVLMFKHRLALLTMVNLKNIVFSDVYIGNIKKVQWSCFLTCDHSQDSTWLMK